MMKRDVQYISTVMNHRVTLHDMILEDVGEGSSHTHDFEKSGVDVRLPEQDTQHAGNFVEIHT